MADTFDIALAFVLHHEGGFVNNPADPGGATNYGISLRTIGTRHVDNVAGWMKVFDKDGDGDIDADDVELFTLNDASVFYDRMWERRSFAAIKHPLIAAKIFDQMVVSGFGGGSRVAQRALRACDKNVIEDGAMGHNTIAAINRIRDDWLMVALCSEAAGYFRDLDRPTFEAGWLNRAYHKPNKEMHYA